MKNAKNIALIAGFGFFSLAVVIQGIIPYLMKQSKAKYSLVTRTVRTELGELREVQAEAVPYAGLIEKGRRVYLREGCWYCHSMYIRPVAGEEKRWGPLPEVGEYSYDLPHMFGTRRIGPDLTRIGGKYGDDWHAGHLFDPKMIVPDSIMPKFTWLFKKEGDRFVLNDDGAALVAFVQNMGMNRGKWRDEFPYQIAGQGSAAIETKDSVENGKKVYERRCIGCHGEKGDGKGAGPSTVLFTAAQPRDFTSGQFKFRTTPSGSLPTDSDLYRTITMGIRGAAMPPWFNLSESDRWDVIHYIKTFYPGFKDAPPDQPIYIPKPPKPTVAMVKRGKEVFEDMGCWNCHGHEGKGNGPAAAGLTDDAGNKILPANFMRGIFKSGPRPEDVYRTFMTGINGTPMPSYSDSITSQDDAWGLAYYVLSFSADKK